MLVLLFVILAVIAGSFWVYATYLAEQNSLIIYWAGSTIEISTTTLTTLLLFAFLCFYIMLRFVKHLASLGIYSKNFRKKKTLRKARKSLVQGLISLVEGHWEKARNQLLADVEHSEIPVLHYLGAARAAHMSEAYELRDDYLKLASETTQDAEVAIAISQAEMQLYAGQLEQARAGLITFLDKHPKHLYAKKLLAKSYFRQEDWKNLSTLLIDLNKQGLLNKKESLRYETASLKGIFQMYANKDSLENLKMEWKKLPANTREKTTSTLLYCRALIAAGDTATANKLITTTLNKEWDDDLIELYGLTTHETLNTAIQQAEKWLLEHDNSPVLFLSLARLYQQNQLWGKSRQFFEASLNLAPNPQGYLEFAELLEKINETDNADLCYKAGLNFCIHKKGQPLALHTCKDGYPISHHSLEPNPPASNYTIDNSETNPQDPDA